MTKVICSQRKPSYFYVIAGGAENLSSRLF